MTVADMNLVFVDVEAAGATPMTGVMTEFGAVHFATRKTFHGVLHDSMPSPENPAKPIVTGRAYPLQPVMQHFTNWAHSFNGRPIFVSDNPAYDFMWIACAFDQVGIPNPFGHSGRRISDFYAGLEGDFTKTQNWKKWRVTPHTHNPVDDAMGNAEAFAVMLGLADRITVGPVQLEPRTGSDGSVQDRK